MIDFINNFTLGILGGGQLGQMLIKSALDFNLDIAVLDPNPQSPCSTKTSHFFVGDLQSKEDVLAFAEKVDLLTIEIENVNIEAVEALESAGKQVFPQSKVLKIIQDKRVQKAFYLDNDIPTAPFVLVDNKEDTIKWLTSKRQEHRDSRTKMPKYINKIGLGGYDGRGVQVVKSTDDFDRVFDKPSIIEDFVDFEKEISVIVARNQNGDMKCYPAVEIHFHEEANLVEFLSSPANISTTLAIQAQQIAEKIIQTLDMIGILAVEMFINYDGQIIVNEIAPRIHNSGHHTIEANVTSQFEQHLRAVLNMPLGNTSCLFPAAMINILGEEGYSGDAKYLYLEELLNMDGVHLHLYGKKKTAPFRKMGHITVIEQDLQKRQQKIDWIKTYFKVVA